MLLGIGAADMDAVEQAGGVVGHGAAGFDARLHQHQHAADVRVLVDADQGFAGQRIAPLLAILGIGQGALVGAFAEGDALHANAGRAAFIMMNMYSRPRFGSPSR